MIRWAAADAARYIQSRARFGIKPGLDRTRALLRELGDPQDSLRFVHIAGTNGKGSTSAMLAAVLAQSGYRTGLYTSPSLHSLYERIAVNGVPVCADDFADAVWRVREAAQRMRGADEPTEFEIMTAAALAHYARADVDIVVLEAGLGGRYDATNVVRPEVTVISNVDYDHMEILGSRLETIAFDKAGILKAGVPALSGATGAAQRVILRVAGGVGAPLALRDRDLRAVQEGAQGFSGQRLSYFGLDADLCGAALRLIGSHQVQNAALALGAVELLRRRGLILPEPAVRRALRGVTWPGRLEVVAGDRPVILDGAHNRPGAAVLAGALRELGIKRAVFVVGVFADKDISGMMRAFAPLMAEVVPVAAQGGRAAPAEVVAQAARAVAGGEVFVHPGQTLARGMATGLRAARAADALVVTGSLSTVAMAREWLGLQDPVDHESVQ